MTDTQKDVCWIALDREVAERWLPDAEGQYGTGYADFAATSEACRKSLVTECVSVAGELEVLAAGRPHEFVGTSSELDGDLEKAISAAALEPGPVTLIVIAGERDG